MQMPCPLSIFLEKSLYSDSLQKGLSAIFLKQQGKLTHTCFGISNLGFFPFLMLTSCIQESGHLKFYCQDKILCSEFEIR